MVKNTEDIKIIFKRRIPKTIQYLDIVEEKTFKYVLMQIFFPKIQDKFKLRIDNLTYDRFQTLFKFRPFKGVYSNYEYSFWGEIGSKDEKASFYIYVSIKSASKRYKYKMLCSKTFAQNMAWITDVYEFDEYYKHLEKI